ncbi:hypothetical protein ACHAWC_000496 [Mediolabrus comicus]
MHNLQRGNYVPKTRSVERTITPPPTAISTTTATKPKQKKRKISIIVMEKYHQRIHYVRYILVTGPRLHYNVVFMVQ